MATTLTRNDWLESSLALLASEGIQSVTVDNVAAQLRVTRGSFYHHFNDKKDLSDELLSYWARKWTTEIQADIDSLDLNGYQSLRALINWSKYRKAMIFDMAIRTWAARYERARDVVEEIDLARLEFIRKQFQSLGFEEAELENRSRLFLYYLISDAAFSHPSDSEIEKEMEDLRLRLLTSH